MKLRLAISLLFLSVMAHAQFITIQGTVTDGSGHSYANGSGRVVLVPQNVSFFTNNNQPVQTPLVISGLDSFGHFSISLPSTAIISPQSSNPQWQFSFTNQSCPNQPIPASFTMTPLSLTTSQDISTTIQAQAAPSQCFGGTGSESLTCTVPLICTPSPIIGTGVLSSNKSGNGTNFQTTNMISPTTPGDFVVTDALGNTVDGNSEASVHGALQVGDAATFGFFLMGYQSGTSGHSIEEFGDNVGNDIQFDNPSFLANVILSNSNRTFALINQYGGTPGLGASTWLYGSPLNIGVNPTPGDCATSCATPSNGFTIDTTGVAVQGKFNDRYGKLRCESGLGDGLNAMASGTYLQFMCVNDSGVTWTITGIHCWTDNAGTSTLNAANNASTGLLTGAVTCNNTKASGGAAGTQSGTTTLASGDAISFTFVADGTSKQTTWTVSLTQ